MDMRLYENNELRKAMGDVLHPGGLALTKKLLDQCQLDRGSCILDIGCGPGQSMDVFQQEGYGVIGIDLSMALLRSASEYGFVACADGVRLPFASEKLDAVFLECVFSLCSDKRSLLSECWRVLKPDGRLVLSDVCFFTNELVASGSANISNCISGAASLGQIQVMLESSSFKICCKNELPQALGEFAAQLVWHTGSRDILPRLLMGENLSTGSCKIQKKSSLGYAAFVSRKI